MDKDPAQQENQIPLEEEVFMTDQEYQLMREQERTDKLIEKIMDGIDPFENEKEKTDLTALDVFFNLMEEENFLEMDKMINEESSTGMKAIHFSIETGNEKVFRFLIQYYTDVNEKDNFGMTPLHYAVIQEHYGIIDELIKRKADLSAEDNDGSTPMSVASKDVKSHIEKCLEMYRNN